MRINLTGILSYLSLGCALCALFTNHPWFVLGIVVVHQIWIKAELRYQRAKSQAKANEVMEAVIKAIITGGKK